MRVSPRSVRNATGSDFDVVLGADLVYSSGAVASGLADCAAAALASGGTLILCCPDGRHGLLELFQTLRADDRWTGAESGPASTTRARGGLTSISSVSRVFEGALDEGGSSQRLGPEIVARQRRAKR